IDGAVRLVSDEDIAIERPELAALCARDEPRSALAHLLVWEPDRRQRHRGCGLAILLPRLAVALAEGEACLVTLERALEDGAELVGRDVITLVVGVEELP